MIKRKFLSSGFSRRTWRRLIGVIVLAGVCVACFQRHAVLRGMGRWLNVAGRLERPVDSVIVLGGGASTRPFVAIEILRAGLARKILIPQVDLSDENRDGLFPPEQVILRQVVLRSGISPDAVVLLTTTVDSTEREAQVAAAYMQSHPDERLAVVTSDFHTRRARMIFSRACDRDADRLVFVGAPIDGFGPSNWWHSEAGAISYLDEYFKLGWALVH